MRDEEFLREVYEGSYRRLVTGMYGMCGDLGTAEEIVQQAFVRAVAEVAAVLNVPDGTVKARLSRGRAALAETLRDTNEVRHG